MFMAGITSHFLALLFKVVIGAVALTLVCLWKPQRGKLLFCTFVGIAFLAEPVLELIAYAAVTSPTFRRTYGQWTPGSRNDQNLAMLVFQIASWTKVICYLISGVLLVAYAAVRNQAFDSNTWQDSQSGEPTAALPGERWDTHLPANRLVEISRRREWAHGIDCLPALLFFCFVVWVFSSITFGGSFHRGLRELVWGLGVLLTLSFLVYLLMKDCVGGVSPGKWLTRCRVVDSDSGIPATPSQTILRNVIFLLFPLGSLVELAVANFRPDRKRLGDLWAGTMVVHGPAQIVDGKRVGEVSPAETHEEVSKKHPLDD